MSRVGYLVLARNNVLKKRWPKNTQSFEENNVKIKRLKMT
jgi:hypothetical protein